VDDLLGVEVQHAACHLPGPAHHLGRQDLGLPLNVFVEGALRAELHDDTVAWGLGAHTPGKWCVCARVGKILLGHNIFSALPLQPYTLCTCEHGAFT